MNCACYSKNEDLIENKLTVPLKCTRYTIEDGLITVRACIPIQAGEEITTQYRHIRIKHKY